MARICKCESEFQHQHQIAADFKNNREFKFAYEAEERKKYLLARTASYGHIKCTKNLIKLGAPINPIHHTEYQIDSRPVLIDMLELSKNTYRTMKHLDCALILADAGATVNLDNEEEVGIVFSIFDKYKRLTKTDAQIITMILKVNTGQEVIEQSDRNGCTFLCNAVAGENLKLVKTFLEMGADPNLSVNNHIDLLKGSVPIEEAAKKGNATILTLLLESGAHATGIALLNAVLHGHTHCATILAKANATITVNMWNFCSIFETMDNRPWHLIPFTLQMLQVGASRLYLDLVRVILDSGIDPSLSDSLNGKLYKNMQPDVMVKAVVDNFCSGNWGEALGKISVNGSEKDIELLVNGSIANNKAYIIHIELEKEVLNMYSLSVTKGLVKCLLKMGGNIDVRNLRGETAFMKIASSCHSTTSQMLYLIEQGADINAVSHGGRSALMRACTYCADVSNFVQLLSAGVVLNGRDKGGRKAIECMEWFNRSRMTSLQILLIAGESDTRFSINDEGEVVSSIQHLAIKLDIELESKFCISSLKSLCRKVIRHYLSYPGATNLFMSVPRLGESRVEEEIPMMLPCLVPYLLFGYSLEDFMY